MKITSDQNKRLVEWALSKGWKVEKCRNEHLVFRHPRCERCVFASATPSDWHSWMRSRSQMRQQMLRAGFSKMEVQ